MCQHLLPDDMSQWPDDDFELLGVSHTDDKRTVRRAYTKLVRRFKPEHAPSEFRRIRDAFETVLQQIEWGYWQDEDADDETNEGTDNAEPPGDDRDSSSVVWPADIEEQCQDAWKLATAGKFEDAYFKLLSLREQHRGYEAIYLRLYWILKLMPDLDKDRVPCDWIAEGLMATRLGGTLAELYRRELVESPKEVTRERSAQLMQCDAEAGSLFDLTLGRWQAAARIEAWEVVLDDMKRLKERFLPDEEALWARAVAQAIETLSFASQMQAELETELARFYQELESLPALDEQISYLFHQADMLAETVRRWPNLVQDDLIPFAWLDLISVAWSHPQQSLQWQIDQLIEEIALDPEVALRYFVRLTKRVPLAADRLGELIASSWYQDSDYSDGLDEEERYDIIREFLTQNKHHDWTASWKSLRRPLMRFCIENSITPDEVCYIVDQEFDKAGSPMEGSSVKIASDGPLEYVCAAYEKFWA